MDHPSEAKSRAVHGQYDATYGNFRTELYEQVRREAYGEDIGQNSWLTTDEQDRFIAWLDLSPGKRLLDVACGAGGPALRIAGRSDCDEEIIAQCGLRLLVSEDVTRNMAEVAGRRHAARASRAPALRTIEGDQPYEQEQEFLAVAARIAGEGRLSRFVYVAEKPR